MNIAVEPKNNLRYAVAIDTGGTFTDVTLFDRKTGCIWTAKTPSTPSDPSIGFMQGIEAAVEKASFKATEIAQIFHGTTVATNLILEGKGAEVGLVTTSGFKHVLEIGRQDIPRRANLFAWIKPTRPVLPERIHEIPERVDIDGNVLVPLDEDAVRRSARDFKKRGVDALAVCFLNSFVHPSHEERTAEIIQEEHPDALVSISADVLRVFREYERSIATVLNVYVMPAVSRYVAQLEQRLSQEMIDAPLLIMKSNGGVVGASEVARVPAYTALSGPAAGVVGAGFVGAAAGYSDIIGIDIGGTSADICLIKDSSYELTSDGKVGNWPLAFPMLDINTVGTGGGSIAKVSETGALTVGPDSAGADPGPACYGRGGKEATITDAHLVLGHLPPYLLNGGMHLNEAASRKALEVHIARPLGLGIEAAAHGILAIADNDMVGAIRVISVERGHDPRNFALIPFGGAGPLHGNSIARLLDVDTVVVPPSPGVLSSMGLLVSQLRADYSRTCFQAPPDFDFCLMETAFRELETEATNWFNREAVPEGARQLTRKASLRYQNQGFELNVDWVGDTVTSQTTGRTLNEFHTLHERLYTFSQKDTPIEIVNLHVAAVGKLLHPELSRLPTGGSLVDAEIERHSVSFEDGRLNVPIYDREKLSSQIHFEGPAIVVQFDSTTLIEPNSTVETDIFGNLIIKVSEPSA